MQFYVTKNSKRKIKSIYVYFLAILVSAFLTTFLSVQVTDVKLYGLPSINMLNDLMILDPNESLGLGGSELIEEYVCDLNINSKSINTSEILKPLAEHKTITDQLSHKMDLWSVIISKIPSMHPLNGKGSLISRFGYRTDPFTNEFQFHEGLDIAAPIGTPVYATADGVVLFAGSHDTAGTYVAIAHIGNYATYYMHLSGILVTQGSIVSKGRLLGYVGSTGRSTGPHLHYEVRLNHKPINPYPYIYIESSILN